MRQKCRQTFQSFMLKCGACVIYNSLPRWCVVCALPLCNSFETSRCILNVWKQLTRTFYFFHSHNTLQILIGDSKVTSKLAKIIHLFLILWWCLIFYFRTLQSVRVVDLFFKLDYFLKTTHSHGLIFHSNITLEILISES